MEHPPFTSMTFLLFKKKTSSDVRGFPRRGFPMLTIFTYQRFLQIDHKIFGVLSRKNHHVLSQLSQVMNSPGETKYVRFFGWSKSPFFWGPLFGESTSFRKKKNHGPNGPTIKPWLHQLHWMIIHQISSAWWCQPYPSEKWWSESQLEYVGMMIPNIWKNMEKSNSMVPNHQPALQLMRQFHPPSQPLLYASEFSWTETTTLENCSFRLSRRRTPLLMLGSLTTKRHKMSTKNQHIPVIPRLYL